MPWYVWAVIGAIVLYGAAWLWLATHPQHCYPDD